MIRLFVLILMAALFATFENDIANSSELYFPTTAGWETISPEKAGMASHRLQEVIDYCREQNSTGLIILYGGRILTEQYWHIDLDKGDPYQNFLIGMTPDGRTIEDVASVQKSIVSFIAAVAREQGKLDIDRSVSHYIGTGWSHASPLQENEITVRQLLSMSSGLTKTLFFQAPSGSVWHYNTQAYSKMVPILEAATGTDISGLTTDWLTNPAGMHESRWISRPWIKASMDANKIGFATSARDLAKFGLLILANGTWNGHALIKTPGILTEAMQPSQHMNPDYGFLWWLNQKKRDPHAPEDSIWALGHFDRVVLIVPSKHLVCVRTGNRAEKNFRYKLSELLFSTR